MTFSFFFLRNKSNLKGIKLIYGVRGDIFLPRMFHCAFIQISFMNRPSSDTWTNARIEELMNML